MFAVFIVVHIFTWFTTDPTLFERDLLSRAYERIIRLCLEERELLREAIRRMSLIMRQILALTEAQMQAPLILQQNQAPNEAPQTEPPHAETEENRED